MQYRRQGRGKIKRAFTLPHREQEKEKKREEKEEENRGDDGDVAIKME